VAQLHTVRHKNHHLLPKRNCPVLVFYCSFSVLILPEEGYVPAKPKASFLTLSVPTPFPSGQNGPWFSQVRLDLEPRLGLWGVGWVEA